MEIKINTETDKPEEIKKFLQELFSVEKTEKIEEKGSIETCVPEKPWKEIKKKPKDEPRNLEGIWFPKIHGKTRETVLDIVKRLEYCSRLEVSKVTDIAESTITGTLSSLKKEGILDSSNDKPKKYWIKDKGDPRLKDALSNSKGVKVSNWKPLKDRGKEDDCDYDFEPILG